MPASAWTSGPRERRRGRRGQRVVDAHESIADEVHRERAGEPGGIVLALGAEHDDGIDVASREAGSRSGPAGSSHPIAEAARAVDDGDLDAARQTVMLQSVVGEDHVAPRMSGEQRPAGGDPVAGDDDRIARAREQQRLVADPARIVLRTDRERRALARRRGRSRGSRCPDETRAPSASARARRRAASCRCRRRRCCRRRRPGREARTAAQHADAVERAPSRDADAEQQRERQQDEREWPWVAANTTRRRGGRQASRRERACTRWPGQAVTSAARTGSRT